MFIYFNMINISVFFLLTLNIKLQNVKHAYTPSIIKKYIIWYFIDLSKIYGIY